MTRRPNTRARDCAPTPEEVNKLLNACDNIIERFIVVAGCVVGMDKGMIAHFRTGWVERTTRHIKIPTKQACDIGKNEKPCSYCQKHGIKQLGFIYWHPKGKTMKDGTFGTYRNSKPRYYGFDQGAIQTIEAFCAAYNKFPLSARSINRVLDSLQKRAGLTHRITAHGMRSFAASNICNRLKGDPVKLRAALGWAPGSDQADEYVSVHNLDKALDEGEGLI